MRAGRCALFVGAGLSAPAGLPTWGALIDHVIAEATPWAVDPKLFPERIDLAEPVDETLREPVLAAIRAALGRARFNTLCRRIERATGTRMDLQVLYKLLDVVFHDSVDRSELGKLAESKRYTELAGHCRDRLGHERFHDLVRQLLTPRGDLPATHRDIVCTPFSCVVTTNFDTLLEDAYARYGGSGVPRAPAGAELGQQGTLLLDRGFFVLKAHGDALRPETMIFTADDYRRVIHSNPAFQAIMSGILLTHAVLFVGYSLNDVNFRLLLDNQLTIFNGNVPPRYAILSGVGAAECEILWRTAKLHVLSYPEGQHAELGRCLSVLADQDTSARRRKPKVTSVEPAEKSRLESLSTLVIDSNGDRLALELVQRRAGAPPHRMWIGGCAHPDTWRLAAQLRRADGAQSSGKRPSTTASLVGFAPNVVCLESDSTDSVASF